MNQIQNKHTIGKYFRKLKGLRKPDKKGKAIEPKDYQKAYFQELKEKGAKFDCVHLAEFELENGLKYEGLIATEDIPSNTAFIKIPKEQLLNTKIAYLSEIKIIFKENPSFFSREGAPSWEDHILLAYLLFEYQKGESSRWYNLIQNLPKELDYLIFWNDKEFELLDDDVLVRKAINERNQIFNELKTLSEILENYPKFFKKETFSFENLKWIHTHLVSRCFGKYLAYVSMVPFCELLNHECVDVYYDFEYNEGNPKTPESYNPSAFEKKFLTEEEEQNHETSEGTYNSEDEFSEEEFKLDFEKENEKEERGKEKFETIKELENSAETIRNYLYNYIDYGDSFSIFFVGKVIKRSNLILSKVKSEEVSHSDASKENFRIQQISQIYKTELYKYYKEVENKYSFSIKLAQKNVKKKDNSPQVNTNLKGKKCFEDDDKWVNDDFDDLIMRTAADENFKKGSQVYFCYGRLSNRTLLMRYGFAIPYNKYDHVHLRINFCKYLSNNDDGMNILRKYELPKIKSFKIKFTKFNMSILTFFKSIYWSLDKQMVDFIFYPADLDFEIYGLQKVQNEFSSFISDSKFTEEENDKICKSPSTSYHEYFAAVYRSGRIGIITMQLKLVQILIEILNRLKSKISYSEAISIVSKLEYPEDYHRNRIILKPYLDRLEFSCKNILNKI